MAEVAEGQKLVKVQRRPRAGGASAPELITPFETIPPEERDPTKREVPTISTIEFTEEGKGYLAPELDVESPPPPAATGPEVPDYSDTTPRTLDDLMGAFPVGDSSGQYYIHVERIQPTSFLGNACKGILRRVRERLTFEQFRDQYGGGVYNMIVYGPPKRAGQVNETGLPRPKALTKPVRMTIPWSTNGGGYPPNLDASYDEIDEEQQDEVTNMGTADYAGIPNSLMARGMTPASAKVVETHLGHQERRELREREDRISRRREQQHEQTSTTKMLLDAAARREEALLETIKELKDDLKATQQNKGSDFDGISKMMGHLVPKTSTTGFEHLREGHRRELDNINNIHKQEIDSLTRRHSEERERIVNQARQDMDRSDTRVTDAERRANERVRDVETRLDSQLAKHREEIDRARADQRTEHAREIDSLKAEQARVVESIRSNFTMQLESERRSHEREIATQKEIANSQLVTERTRLEVENKRLESDIRRRDKDVEEFKKLAEKNKDLGKMLEDAKRTAELLGYAPASENSGEPPAEMDWKQMLLGAAVEGAKRLPEILKSAGDAAAAVRGGQQRPAQQMQQPQMYPPPQPQQLPPGYVMPPRRAFATEDSGLEPQSPPQFYEPTPQAMRPMPLQQQAAPPPPPPPVSQMLHEQAAYQQQAGYQPPPGYQPPQQASVGQPAQAQFPPLPGQPPAAMASTAPSVAPPTASVPPPPPAAPAPKGDPAMDGMVLSGREQLETWFSAGLSPADIARGLVNTHGRTNVQTFLPMINTEQVVGSLERAGFSNSRLLSRKGRRYLREIELALMAELSPPQGVAAS